MGGQLYPDCVANDFGNHYANSEESWKLRTGQTSPVGILASGLCWWRSTPWAMELSKVGQTLRSALTSVGLKRMVSTARGVFP